LLLDLLPLFAPAAVGHHGAGPAMPSLMYLPGFVLDDEDALVALVLALV
jgi:hypothetical protein